MLILTIKTDQAIAELDLFNNKQLIQSLSWESYRKLADTIHLRIYELLDANNYTWERIEGIVCFRGPGSFTGLRIGLTVANTLAYSLNCPIVGSQGDSWQPTGISKLLNGMNEIQVLPDYGSEVKTSKPKK